MYSYSSDSDSQGNNNTGGPTSGAQQTPNAGTTTQPSGTTSHSNSTVGATTNNTAAANGTQTSGATHATSGGGAPTTTSNAQTAESTSRGVVPPQPVSTHPVQTFSGVVFNSVGAPRQNRRRIQVKILFHRHASAAVLGREPPGRYNVLRTNIDENQGESNVTSILQQRLRDGMETNFARSMDIDINADYGETYQMILNSFPRIKRVGESTPNLR